MAKQKNVGNAAFEESPESQMDLSAVPKSKPKQISKKGRDVLSSAEENALKNQAREPLSPAKKLARLVRRKNGNPAYKDNFRASGKQTHSRDRTSRSESGNLSIEKLTKNGSSHKKRQAKPVQSQVVVGKQTLTRKQRKSVGSEMVTVGSDSIREQSGERFKDNFVNSERDGQTKSCSVAGQETTKSKNRLQCGPRERTKRDSGRPASLSRLEKRPKRRRRSTAAGEKGEAEPMSGTAGPDIAALLRVGEGAQRDAYGSDDSDWEAVEGHASELATKGFVEVTLPSELAHQLKKKRKKGEFDAEAYLRRRVAAARRAGQALLHRVHLLCLLSRALLLNALLNSETLLATAMSMLPSAYAYPPERVSRRYLEQFVRWFCGKVLVAAPAEGGSPPSEDVFANLETRLRCRTARTPLERGCLFVLILRAIGVECRLVLSLQPTPLRPPPEPAANQATAAGASRKPAGAASSASRKSAVTTPSASRKSAVTSSNTSRRSAVTAAGDRTAQNKTDRVEKKQDKARIVDKTGSKSKTKSDPDRPSKSGTRSSSTERVRRRPVRQASRRQSAAEAEDSSGDEFEPAVVRQQDRRVLSTDSADSGGGVAGRTPHDQWVEVFVEEEQLWICVDVDGGAVDCPDQIRKKATQPLVYVVGCDNSGYLKDVTVRYEPRWHSHTRRLRAPADWWAEAVAAWRPPATSRDREEDQQIENELQQRPLPQAIAEFKGNPLYALERHLLKFEAIYPPSAVPLGYIGKGDKKEPVYARQCVHMLHSRETWIKQARVVKPDEKPYKIVKARPKWDRLLQRKVAALPLEVFGRWQTAEYVPPPAENGLVPRNSYGNVELFQPSMLPAGTVHLPLDGLSRIARKLGIDCAPAMVGWDYHCGGSHPVFEGYVVCAEFEETLTDAWHQEQQEAQRRKREQREKRALINWARLVRALRIRQRLSSKYSFSDDRPADTLADKHAAGKQAGTTRKRRTKASPASAAVKQEPHTDAKQESHTAIKRKPSVKSEPTAEPSLEQAVKSRLDATLESKAELRLSAQRVLRAAQSAADASGDHSDGERGGGGVERAMAGMTFRQLALSSDSEDSDGAATALRGPDRCHSSPKPAVAAFSPEPAAAAQPGPSARRRGRVNAAGKRASSAATTGVEDVTLDSQGSPALLRPRRRKDVDYSEAAGSDTEPLLRDDDLSSEDEQPFVKAARRGRTRSSSDSEA